LNFIGPDSSPTGETRVDGKEEWIDEKEEKQAETGSKNKTLAPQTDFAVYRLLAYRAPD
jgi:hypothetical protein